MPLWSLSEEKIEELNKECKKLESAYKELEATTEKELWKKDIASFRHDYEKRLKDEIREMNEEYLKVVKKSRVTPMDLEEEDEVEVLELSSSKSKPVVSKRPKVSASVETDKPSPKKKTVAKKAPKQVGKKWTKAIVISEDESSEESADGYSSLSESEVEVVPKAKKRGGPRARREVKEKVKAIIIEEEEKSTPQVEAKRPKLTEEEALPSKPLI